ncbi:Nitrilase and fragile histidine triad fusion protein NitFhit [Globodera pallida]|nr:Nitrilase and fragile histidine triad fusion protein NitFhit [Globodera pallida]
MVYDSDQFEVSSSQAAMSACSRRALVAVCQLNVQHDLQHNFEQCARLIKRAGARDDCKMVFLPECFDYIGRNVGEQINQAMCEKSQYIAQFRELAKQHGIWLSLGGFHHKRADLPAAQFPRNTHLVIDAEGKTRAEYDKLHLFDLDLPGKVRLMESEFSSHGHKLVPPVETPVGRLGLSICYDLRFPELSLYHRHKGAEVLSFPSSFTLNTGMAHWESLLRARAIECQCYVVAAAQTGKHNDKRISYGHSMVVDPWGTVVAQCSDREDICFAELDLGYVEEVRKNQPVFSHRRSDLYTVHYNEHVEPKDTATFQFGHVQIDGSQCFLRSSHCFAFVNLKPLVPGHVLVSPLRTASRLTELSDQETADLFVVAKNVQKMLESIYGTDSFTQCVQDGPHAGQTVKHVHVHVLPRTDNDFGNNPDRLYAVLQGHEGQREARCVDEMASEATRYRQWLAEEKRRKGD